MRLLGFNVKLIDRFLTSENEKTIITCSHSGNLKNLTDNSVQKANQYLSFKRTYYKDIHDPNVCRRYHKRPAGHICPGIEFHTVIREAFCPFLLFLESEYMFDFTDEQLIKHFFF